MVEVSGMDLEGTPSNNALHQTRRGGAAASQPVVEARLAGERKCCAGASGAMNTFGGDHPNAVPR